MIEYRVTGKVQGVFFRKTTITLAQSLNLRGWVRNDPDGSVVGQAQGPADKVEEFKAFLHKGPELARVDKVDIRESQDDPDLPFFELRRR